METAFLIIACHSYFGSTVITRPNKVTKCPWGERSAAIFIFIVLYMRLFQSLCSFAMTAFPLITVFARTSCTSLSF